ncbi:ATP-binding cassette domain-containing protein [Aquabacterium sp. A08]|uniref:ABC transporter ATP-binding protein n=1 Tax=Aquabacterium sp. A08 TaxID=2718532 RepID=UPI00141E990F|nr:ATP-binding cassette domain-containing protein [Aquabacterium sp. A08]NIC40048.1 ATP-binding cassette domain-containing protein [Aquabacterium sp. A08]
MAALGWRLAGVRCRVGTRELWPAGLDATLAPGVTWVGGDEGSGKTTLLRLLAGACAPSEGRLASLADAAPRVAWMDPAQPQDDRLTVRDALAQALQPFDGGDAAALARLLPELDLTPHLDKSLYMLSTGSRRKVGMAATLASGADALLFDQPFMALDRPSERAIVAALAALAADGRRLAVVADYQPPPGLKLSGQIDLDRCR